MNFNKRFIIAAIGLIAIAFMVGCLGHGYGKLKLESRYGGQMTVEKLVQNWQDYDIYYAGHTLKHPSAAIFIPSNGSKTEVTDRWTKIEDTETLTTVVGWLEFQESTGHSYFPYLYRLLGPDDQFHGYFFSSWNHVMARVVDDGTLRVYDLPLPPYLWINEANEDDFRG